MASMSYDVACLLYGFSAFLFSASKHDIRSTLDLKTENAWDHRSLLGTLPVMERKFV